MSYSVQIWSLVFNVVGGVRVSLPLSVLSASVVIVGGHRRNHEGDDDLPLESDRSTAEGEEGGGDYRC